LGFTLLSSNGELAQKQGFCQCPVKLHRFARDTPHLGSLVLRHTPKKAQLHPLGLPFIELRRGADRFVYPDKFGSGFWQNQKRFVQWHLYRIFPSILVSTQRAKISRMRSMKPAVMAKN
jgi:hypothetical protein